MTAIHLAILAFLVLESLNVLILYFYPTSNKGNGMGCFTAWEKAKADPEVFALLRYLVNWVAGTKLIFIALLLVILITGGETTKIWAAVALVLSIATFFWRLFPAIRRMDASGAIKPRGYSRTLGIMIGVFIAVFAAALAVALTHANHLGK